MSWQLLVPVLEKLIDAGVEYYKSDSQSLGATTTEVVEPSRAGATILLAVEPIEDSTAVNQESIE